MVSEKRIIDELEELRRRKKEKNSRDLKSVFVVAVCVCVFLY